MNDESIRAVTLLPHGLYFLQRRSYRKFTDGSNERDGEIFETKFGIGGLIDGF